MNDLRCIDGYLEIFFKALLSSLKEEIIAAKILIYNLYRIICKNKNDE